MDKKTIEEILKASKGKRAVNFSDLVEVTSGHRIIPLDTSSNEDRELLSELEKGANHLMNLTARARRRLKANRVNEVGKRIENEFVEILSGTSLKTEILSKAGYPNIKLEDRYGRITYLESKATSRDWGGGLRSFFYSSGGKIHSDARHLLIGWKVLEEEPKYWELKGWKIVELSNLKVKLKNEFNATNKELYDESIVLREGPSLKASSDTTSR